MGTGTNAAGFRSWAARHNARVVKNMSRRSPVGLIVGGAVWGALAVLLIVVAVADRAGSAAVGGFAIPVLLAAALSAYCFWRAARFRIAGEAAGVGGALALSAARWRVTLQPADVKQVVLLRRNPYGGLYNQPLAAWGVWLRIDARTKGMRRCKCLVWRADAPAFLEHPRRAGFPVVGEVAPVQDPS